MAAHGWGEHRLAPTVLQVEALQPDQRSVFDSPRMPSDIAALCPAAPGAALMPLALLTLYGTIAEEITFLRSIASFGRGRLIPIVDQTPHRRWECRTVGAEPDTPGVLCRLGKRSVVPWAQVYATLWPERFRDVSQQDAGEAPRLQTHRMCITFASARRKAVREEPPSHA